MINWLQGCRHKQETVKGSEAKNHKPLYSINKEENICCHGNVALTLGLHNIAYRLADPGIRAYSTLVLLMYEIYTHGVFVYANHSQSIMLEAVSVAKVCAW